MTGGNTLGEVKVLTRGGESRGRVSFPFPRCRRRQSAHEAARATWWLAGDLFDTHDAPTLKANKDNIVEQVGANFLRTTAHVFLLKREAHGAPKDRRQMMVLNRAFAEN
jgi:hypothetical protein